MKLWSGVLSNNAAKVRVVLAEKQIEHQIIEVPWRKETLWEPKPAELWQLNPRGQVPVLVDDDVILMDSTIINEYLEELKPGLLPTGIKARSICRLWEDQGDFYQAPIGTLIQDVFLNPEAPLTDAAKQAIAQLEGFYGQIDAQLKGSEWLCDEFSLADISVFFTVAFANMLGAPIVSGTVQAWFDRAMARPSIESEYTSMMTAVTEL